MASARNTISSAETLLDLIHSRREVARQSGIETIAIEILAIMQGQAFTGVIDAIEEAVQEEQPVSLTRMGLSTLRRIEALVAEASMNIRKFSDEELGAPDDRVRLEADSPKAHLEGRRPWPSAVKMGQSISIDLPIWIPFAMLGIVVVAVVVAVIVVGKSNTLVSS
jgi:hypothetical protein